jgi:hypothetical protein
VLFFNHNINLTSNFSPNRSIISGFYRLVKPVVKKQQKKTRILRIRVCVYFDNVAILYTNPERMLPSWIICAIFGWLAKKVCRKSVHNSIYIFLSLNQKICAIIHPPHAADNPKYVYAALSRLSSHAVSAMFQSKTHEIHQKIIILHPRNGIVRKQYPSIWLPTGNFPMYNG